MVQANARDKQADASDLLIYGDCASGASENSDAKDCTAQEGSVLRAVARDDQVRTTGAGKSIGGRSGTRLRIGRADFASRGKRRRILGAGLRAAGMLVATRHRATRNAQHNRKSNLRMQSRAAVVIVRRRRSFLYFRRWSDMDASPHGRYTTQYEGGQHERGDDSLPHTTNCYPQSLRRAKAQSVIIVTRDGFP